MTQKIEKLLNIQINNLIEFKKEILNILKNEKNK